MCKTPFLLEAQELCGSVRRCSGDAVTHGVTFAEHQKNENRLKVAPQKMTYRGLRNSEPVETENIGVINRYCLSSGFEQKPTPFRSAKYFSYQEQMPLAQNNNRCAAGKDSRQSRSSPQQCLSMSQALSRSSHMRFENRCHVFDILSSFTRTKSILASITSTRNFKYLNLATVPALSSMLSTLCFWLSWRKLFSVGLILKRPVLNVSVNPQDVIVFVQQSDSICRRVNLKRIIALRSIDFFVAIIPVVPDELFQS